MTNCYIPNVAKEVIPVKIICCFLSNF